MNERFALPTQRAFVRLPGHRFHLKQAEDRIRKCCLAAASIDQYGHRGDNPARLLNDVNCLLHPAPAGHDIFGNYKPLAFSDHEPAPEYKPAILFLRKDRNRAERPRDFVPNNDPAQSRSNDTVDRNTGFSHVADKSCA